MFIQRCTLGVNIRFCRGQGRALGYDWTLAVSRGQSATVNPASRMMFPGRSALARSLRIGRSGCALGAIIVLNGANPRLLGMELGRDTANARPIGLSRPGGSR